MMNPRQHKKLFVLTGAFVCALVIPTLVQAGPVLVEPMVSTSNGLVHYNYSITNNSPLDLSVVTISVINSPDAIQNLVAPTGFNANFDAGLGLLDFLENTQSFTTGTTVSGFQFDSPFGPNASSFTALALDATSGLIEFSGSTSAPAASAVPEPSTFILMLTSSMLLIASRIKGLKHACNTVFPG